MRTYQKLTLVILCGVGLVVIVLLYINLPNETSNGFTRKFIPAKAQLLDSKTLPPFVRGMAGMHEDNLYFYTDSLNRLLKTNIRSLNNTTVSLPISRTLIDRIGAAYSIKVTPKFVHVFANNLPGIITVSRHSGNATIHTTKQTFTSEAVVSNTKFILRQYTPAHNGMQFVKMKTGSENIQTESGLSLNDQDRGMFSGDGQLHYDSQTQLLVYTHYYYNAVLAFDCNLKPSIRFQTIDTVQRFRNAQPHPLVINQKSCTDKGIVYICSNLKADNETYKEYFENIPVDLYQIETGAYLGSIYLPLSNRKLIKSVLVNDQILAALYHDGKLMLFSIHHILQALEPSVPL